MNKLRQFGKYTLLLRRWSPLALSIFVPLILLALILLSASTAEAEPVGPQAIGDFNSAIQVTNVGISMTDITVSYSDGTSETMWEAWPWESALFEQEYESHDPGWAGGAAIDSGWPVVALVNQYAPGKSSIYNGFGFYDAPTSFVLPILMKNYYGHNTTVFVQNVGTGDATIAVSYSDSLNRSETIVPGDTAILIQSNEDHADGWMGSAFVSADQPIVAVVNVESEASFRTYRGFPYAFGRSSAALEGSLYRFLQQQAYLSLPLIKRNWTDNTDSTAILVHNMGDLDANVVVDFYAQDGSLISGPTGVIPPDGSMSFPQMGDDNLPDPFLGSAVISADQPIVALVGQNKLDGSYYEDFSEGTTSAILPLVQKGYYGYNTEIAIQNVGAEPIEVVVNYEGDAEGTPVAETEVISGLLPHTSALLEQANNPDLPAGFSGHATVDATGPIAVVVNQVYLPPVTRSPNSPVQEGTLSTYNGVDLSTVDVDAFAPAVMHQYQPYEGPVISGVVVNPDESPITGDTWACLHRINSSGDWVEIGCTDVYSGDGYFEFPTPDPYIPGDFVVEVGAPWESGFFDAVPVNFYLSVPESLDLGVLPLTYASFEGMVYEPGGVTATLGYVAVLDAEGYEVAGGDYESGYYAIGGVPAGDFTLVAYPPDGSPFGESEPLTVTVPPGSQYTPGNTQYNDLYLVEMQGESLDVLVVDPLGDPIAAHVRLWSEWGDCWDEQWNDSTSAGPAQFQFLPCPEYWAQAWPMGSDIPALANSEKVLVDPTLGSLTLALQYPDITGVVRTPEDTPLPPAYDEWQNMVHPAEINVHNDDWSVDIYLETNMNGEFSLALPYHDHYILRAKPMCETNLAISYTQSLPVEFSAPDGATPQTDLGSVRLTYPRVWGWVLGPDDVPVSTWVDMWNDDWSYTDGDETLWYNSDEIYKPFRFGGMPDGHYFVQSMPPYDNVTGLGNSNVEEFDVPPGSQYDPGYTEQITLYIGIANVIGELRYPPDYAECPDCPVSWVDVGIHTEDWTFDYGTQTDENGMFTFSGLEPGITYVVEVFLPDYLLLDWAPPEPWRFFLTSPDQQEETILYLQPFECIKFAFGTVTYKEGTAVDDAWIYAHHESSGRWAETKTDEFGEYELCLGEGLWKMGVEPIYDVTTPPDWWFDPAMEQWVWFTPTLETERQPVHFTVLRHNESDHFQVTGVVTTPTDVPIPAGAVGIDLCSETGACFGGPVDSNGEFSFWAPPGTYEAWVWVDPTASESFPFGEPFDNGRLVDVDENPKDIGVFKLRALADRTAQVSGRVIVTGTGQGLAGVEVEAWTEDDYASTDTITGGHYTLKLFPGYWEGGPLLTPQQEQSYVVLPPQYKSGHLAAGETISNVNFYLARRNATIRGRVVDETGNTIIDVDAIVFAEYCANHECWTVSEDKAQGGSFELKVVGGRVYTVGVWLPTGGYMPGPPKRVEVAVGETKTGVLLTLIDAGTLIWGDLKSDDPGNPYPHIEASVSGSAPDGLWVEDTLWETKTPYQYNLWVPTPVSDTITWTLKLWVDPSTGYIAHPSYPRYPVVIGPGMETVPSTMFVMKLDTEIVGTVHVGTTSGASAPNVKVFANGVKGTNSEGLYFEAKTNASGTFTMPVLPGEYMLGAHLPPNLAATHLPPKPMKWTSMDDNPVNIVLLPKPTEKVEIVGTLYVTPTGALPDGTTIRVFGWSEDTGSSEVTGTLGSQYRLPVTADTTWHVWAAYVNPANNDFYRSRERRVKVGNVTVTGKDLLLERAFRLPGSQCWTIDPAQSRRLEFPRRPDMLDLLPPMLTVKSGTFSDTVRICATPRAALPEGQRLIGLAYDLEARDNQGKLITENFNKQMRLEFYFDEDALKSVPSYPYPSPADLMPAYYSTVYNRWVALDDAFVDEEDMFATGKLDHFTKFSLRSSPGEENNIYLPLVLRNYGG